MSAAPPASGSWSGWTDTPLGHFSDAMVETATGHRVLLAPHGAARDFIAATYTFDEVRLEPLEITDPWRVRSPSLTLDLTVGRRTPLGVLLRAVPDRLAESPAWCTMTDPVARVLMRGVRTRGTAGGARREWYGATDTRRVTALSGSFDGADLGGLSDVDPPCRFGFSSTPRRPSVTTVVTTGRPTLPVVEQGGAPATSVVETSDAERLICSVMVSTTLAGARCSTSGGGRSLALAARPAGADARWRSLLDQRGRTLAGARCSTSGGGRSLVLAARPAGADARWCSLLDQRGRTLAGARCSTSGGGRSLALAARPAGADARWRSLLDQRGRRCGPGMPRGAAPDQVRPRGGGVELRRS